MNWFRMYNKTPHSPTLRRVAHEAGSTVAHTLAIWSYMLCFASANEGEDRGTLNGWEDAECALVLGMDRAVVGAIRKAMVMRLVDDGGHVLKWSEHQSTSDNSTHRWRAWNERRKQNQDVKGEPTLGKRAANVGPTSKSRGEENRYTVRDKSLTPPKASPRVADEDFERFWKAYPRKVGKGSARKAWEKALPKAERGAMTIISAVNLTEWDRREDCRFVPHPATWLNREGWLDNVEEDA